MAASVAKRDTDGAPKGHDRPDRQQVKPNRSSRRKCLHHFGIPPNPRTGKRHRSAQGEEEDENTTEHRRKSRRIQERCQFPSYHFSDSRVTDHGAADPQNPRISPKTSRKSPRLQEKQAANQQRIARGPKRSSQRQALKHYQCRKKKDKDRATSPADPGAHKSSQLLSALP